MTYDLVESFPLPEQFALTRQATRAAVSIPSNIAEGSAKNSIKEYTLFIEYALGSSYELETLVLIAESLNYGDGRKRTALLSMIDEKQKMLQSFIRTLKKE